MKFPLQLPILPIISTGFRESMKPEGLPDRTTIDSAAAALNDTVDAGRDTRGVLDADQASPGFAPAA